MAKKKQSAIDKLLGRNRSEPEPESEPIEFAPKQEEPQVEEFMEIGGSPVPGITLRQVLRGHTGTINRIAWSPDGRYLASPSDDTTVRIWDMEQGKCLKILQGEEEIQCVAWSPDGKLLAFGYTDIRLWDVKSFRHLSTFAENTGSIYSISWSPDGNKLASTSWNNVVNVWNIYNQTLLQSLAPHSAYTLSVLWSPNGDFVISGAGGTEEHGVRIFNTQNGNLISILKGHTSLVNCLAWWPKTENFVSGSGDTTIRVWSLNPPQALGVLEKHTGGVSSVSFSPDGKYLASKSSQEVILWSTDPWEAKTTIPETGDEYDSAIAFHPHLPRLATLCEQGASIRMWDIDSVALGSNTTTSEAIRYTTAKLVLVGDSGVGKTGLGWRLAHNEFKEHSSTHGQQFWVVPELKKTREDGTECEAVLWDLAGQHIYRSIHSIFLDDVDASLVLFDPTNRQEPLKGAQFWLEQLKGKKQLPPSVLVGARLDRGAPVLSQQELDQFCQKYGISGGYIGTSAKSGEGVDILLQTLKDQIPWDQMTTTVTTVTFKRIKDYLKTLKEKTDRKGVLVRPEELRHQLEATDKDWQFSDAEMMTAVGHLANHGYVTILKSSSGDEYILLVPELLASVASSIFLHADKHPRELGAINETDLLQGKYPIDEFKGLEKEEQQVLLDATVVRFLEHSLCFRETLGNDNLLIFPSLIKQKRPLKDDVPATDDISYIVRGRVENIYASLVVLLGYTSSFTRINQWANQAQYETEDGDICGFRLVEDREGEIELILYYANEMEKEERDDFQALFEQFLYKRDVEVTPFPPVICLNGHRQERATVVKSLREGKKNIFCYECGAKTDLPDLEAQQSIGIEATEWLKREEALARLRNVYETHLVNVKGYRRGWASPRCYLSHTDDQKDFVEKLSRDLTDAGVFIIEETSKVEENDNILIIDSPEYKLAWEVNDKNMQDDMVLVKPRLADGKRKGLISITRSGLILEHNLKACKSGSFCDPTHYVVNLFNLILDLYEIPLNHAGFMPLRQSLHSQWEQTLAEKVKWEKLPEDDVTDDSNTNTEKEIFVSYAWGGESEKIVNELDQAFQDRGVTIVRDKRDLGFKGRIKGFMETIGKGKAVVLVISEKYLKSENCLFELLQIAKHGDFEGRIFPVVLDDAKIYKAVDRIRYVQHWEGQLKELDDAMRTVSATNMQGFREDIDLYAEIRANLPRLTDILKDMNTLTPSIHRDADFQILFDAVMAKLEE